MKTQPKVKMYVEIKNGQDDKICKPYSGNMYMEMTIGKYKRKFQVPTAEKTAIEEELMKSKLSPGFKYKFYNAPHRKVYINILGHRIKKLGKNDLIIPVHGKTLDETLAEVARVEEDLRKQKIKFERKCTWVCGM